MALAVEEREYQGVLILALVGDLTMGPEDMVFRTVLRKCRGAGTIQIILDCSRLENMDSVGLGTLVFCHLALRRARGKVVLLNIARTQMHLFVLAKLETIFDVFANEQDAVNSFFPDRAVRHYDILKFVEKQNHRAEPSTGQTTLDEPKPAP
jgi:anti-sigma B factor antagonist